MTESVGGCIRIAGLTAEEWLALPDEEFDLFVFTSEPIVFDAGSAEILAQFKLASDRLILDLAHIDGGGEGVLPTIAAIAKRAARRRQLDKIEWLIHATRCASPNPRLRPVLERRGFVVEDIDGVGLIYRKVELLEGAEDARD